MFSPADSNYLVQSTFFNCRELMQGSSKILYDLEVMKGERYHFLFFKGRNVSPKVRSETHRVLESFIKTEKLIIWFHFSFYSHFYK